MDSTSRTSHSTRPLVRVALPALLAALACALPASAAASENSASASANLRVLDQNGQSVEVLGTLTLEQTAALLKLTPAELLAEIESLPGYSALSALLNEPLSPTTTLSHLTSVLASSGLSPAALKALIEAHLGPLAEDPEALRRLVRELLDDVRLNGLLPWLAGQLGTSVNALLEGELLPSTAQGAADALGTTVDHLSGLLGAAGAIAQPLAATAPVVLSPITRRLSSGATQLVVTPSGGGVTMTTVSSSTPPASAVLPAKSAAFSVLSVKESKRGLIIETVFLPEPGQLAISATSTRKATPRGRHARAGAGRAATLARVSRSLASGTHTLTLRPSRKGISARRIRVGLSTAYKALGGTSTTRRNSLVYRFPSAGRRR